MHLIKNADVLPGYPSGTREELSLFWHTLVQRGYCEATLADEKARPCFVGAQCLFESVLAEQLAWRDGAVTSALGIIHTAMPATPLCTQPDDAPPDGLMHESVANDPARRATVSERSKSVRDILKSDNARLFVAYSPDGPNTGRDGRSAAQLDIYDRACEEFANTLTDEPLTQALPEALSGALYLFRGADGEKYAFGLRMSQANRPGDGDRTNSIWLSAVTDLEVEHKVAELRDFLDGCGSAKTLSESIAAWLA
ncbi:hypothetical protein WL22_12340 [Burkholderia ubonensis]|uniref:hypothetical protein n=1 Tax=Burkholderia ubonensis TaxID=101571 RepID=UPI00075615EA|nr:hypothetical protein [Burkholderia ubonensis]KVZ72396.1 hypothetical protein WL22_12340 [Burkholderia ubonensis]